MAATNGIFLLDFNDRIGKGKREEHIFLLLEWYSNHGNRIYVNIGLFLYKFPVKSLFIEENSHVIAQNDCIDEEKMREHILLLLV